MAPDDRHPNYRFRDLLRVPCLLSLSRVPLAAVFPMVVDDPRRAFAVLALSGLSDVLDGWWARRFHQTSDLGAALDGFTDKVFVLAVALTLLVTARLTPAQLLLLGARDIGEILLLLALLRRRDARFRHEQPRADVFGKATTLLQFVAVSLALVGHPHRALAAWGAGVLGAVTAIHYARRMA